MIWLELRTHNHVYSPGWNFTESAWAPIKKKKGGTWPFWTLVNNVVKGDIIFHLKHVGADKRFLGYSTAVSDGYLTYESPSDEDHDWNFSESFYRVDLDNFQPLVPSIRLIDYFSENEIKLRDFYNINKLSGPKKKRLFYTIQSNQLQCLFGAYFSEFDEQLAEMLTKELRSTLKVPQIHSTTNTSTILKALEQRIGQQKFSDNVKGNYNYKCCFPGCKINDPSFLIGGHIARWSDNENLRGNTANGLCFCLMHDKAFEKGFFTLDSNYRVVLIHKRIRSKWITDFLILGENLEIKPRQINPLLEALENHWERIGYKP
jgi:predicted restriction endonuclease